MRQINQSIPIHLSIPYWQKGPVFISPKNAVVLLFLDLFRLLWR
jgi:hypothetical protein